MGELANRKRKRKRVSFSVPDEQAPKDDGLTALQKGLHVVVDVEHGLDSEHSKEVLGASQHAQDNSDSQPSDSIESDSENSSEKSDDGNKAGRTEKSTSSEADSQDTEEAGLDEGEIQKCSDDAIQSQGIDSFAEMHLDERVSWAVARLGWRQPTVVQRRAIPAALEGRDVLISAPTGSGKTAAYAIPLVNEICRAESARGHAHADGTCALVLVPTRELAAQVSSQLRKLMKFVDGVHVATLSSLVAGSTAKLAKHKRPGFSSKQSTAGQSTATAFARTAEVVVGTPAAVIEFRREHGAEAFKNVSFIVIDEADLVLSYGHGADAQAALAAVPSNAQALLVSATLEAEGMSDLRKVFFRRPITVKITASAERDTISTASGPGSSHYFARLSSMVDRFLVTYAMLRLNVISGKVLVFTNSINAAFRLKLFLDKFKVKSAVLNSELPANSRIHCVEQFNAGIFDILIATDEVQRDDSRETDTEGLPSRRERTSGECSYRGDEIDGTGSEASDGEGDRGKSKPKKSKAASQRRKKSGGDVEFGVARGVDFRGVSAVINFDVPQSDVAYIHRAGRTARAGASGTVLTLVVGDHEQASVSNMGLACQAHISPLAFRMDQIESFRYRVEDCLRSVTDGAVHEARLADVRREMINSDRLKDYFEDNPMDFEALKHDGSLAKHVPEHLARVPAYLLPPALRGAIPNETLVGGRPRPKKRNFMVPKRGGVSKNGGDPLKTFSASRRSSGSSRDRYQARHGTRKKPVGTAGGAKGGRRK